MKLNSVQLEAVKYYSGPLLVLAGAGSGKTRVITHKIAYLINECSLSARNIYALTFTNKAASEMSKRASSLGQSKAFRGLSISTFHALGLDIIRHEHLTLHLKKQFSIFDTLDVLSLLRDIIKQQKFTLPIAVEFIQAQISKWKNNLLTSQEAYPLAQNPQEIEMIKIYEQYEKTLRAYNAVDFDDLILQPVLLLRQYDAIREKWQNKIHYLLVDEYQDTNSCQYELVKLLTGVRQQFTVVGDDDQSIYAWRGAKAENLVRLQEDFPHLNVIKLEQNYRSYGCILKSANELIKHNPHVFEKKLWSELGFGEPLKVITCKNEEHEAERVVNEIIHHQFKHRTKYKDYVILYRGNFQARIFERTLRDQHIPYALTGGTSFFDRSEVKDILAYLRLLINPDDDAAFLRIVNLPRRGIGIQTIEYLSHYAKQRACSLLTAIDELGLEQSLTGAGLNSLREFSILIQQKRRALDDMSPQALILELLLDISYETWLYDNEKHAKSAAKKMETLLEFIAWIQRLADKDESASLADIINKVMLINRLNQDEESDVDQVQLMTLHAAKGLEFPHVFLVGMEEELLPHRVSIDEDNIEEERRLAYVGITRAQKSLTFTLAKVRKRQGELTSCEPSRFLKEIPEEYLEWYGEGVQLTPEQSQAQAKSHLDTLKSLLNEN